MEIKTLKQSNLKRNIIISVVVILIISALILNYTKARYRSVSSVPIVNSEVNYVRPDINIIALYIDGKQASELDSSENYTLDTSNSTCTYKDGTAIENLRLSYDSETGSLSVSPFTTRGTKCYLYFKESIPVKDTLLSYYPTVLTRTDFNTTVTDATTGTIYKSADSSQYDNDGEVYYFAGNPTDNWVSFAGFYWRIIRINGDGSIRLIYQGTSANTTGTETQIGTSVFNSEYSDNMYAGFMYTNGNAHGTGISSTIKEELDIWYENNLTLHTNDIDINAGFCNDREMNTTTYYNAYIRLVNNKAPNFKCNNSDLFTHISSNKGNKSLSSPIGLITADEVAFAGGVYNTNNTYYYLYTGNSYWTMSPFYFIETYVGVFSTYWSGSLNFYSVGSSSGIRPVINLKADVTISSGNGTASTPFVIE